MEWDRKANGYRLPTEAEWEYCARAKQETLYAGSDNWKEVAWGEENSGGQTQPIGQKKPNSFGLYDMIGNVWEWIWDTADVTFVYKFNERSIYQSQEQINQAQ